MAKSGVVKVKKLRKGQRIRVNGDGICKLCHPPKKFRDLLSYGRHMVHYHHLTAEKYKKGKRKGYNTGWWIKN
jgi:hypothetical protein